MQFSGRRSPPSQFSPLSGERLSSYVDVHVSLQLRFLTEPLSADFARVRFLPCVNDRVPFQYRHLAVSLPADVADVRLLAGVDPQVPLQVVLVLKNFSTEATLYRSGICVKVTASL